MKQKAIAFGIPVRQHKTLEAPEVRDEFIAFDADLAILARSERRHADGEETTRRRCENQRRGICQAS